MVTCPIVILTGCFHRDATSNLEITSNGCEPQPASRVVAHYSGFRNLIFDTRCGATLRYPATHRKGDEVITSTELHHKKLYAWRSECLERMSCWLEGGQVRKSLICLDKATTAMHVPSANARFICAVHARCPGAGPGLWSWSLLWSFPNPRRYDNEARLLHTRFIKQYTLYSGRVPVDYYDDDDKILLLVLVFCHHLPACSLCF